MRTITAIGCLLLVGCGQPSRPIVEQLDPQEQAKVDSAWENMLSPPDRLDHELFYDVIMTFRYHDRGVNRWQVSNETDVADGRVVMTIKYDRLQPAANQLTIVHFSPDGRELPFVESSTGGRASAYK